MAEDRLGRITSNAGAPLEAVLRAVGHLLVAIGGDARVEAPRAAARAARARRRRPPPGRAAAARLARSTPIAPPRTEFAVPTPPPPSQAPPTQAPPAPSPPPPAFEYQSPPAFQHQSPPAAQSSQPDLAPIPSEAGEREGIEEIEFILADARERAHRIIDESVTQAQQLLERSASEEQRAIEAIRRSIAELTAEVRGINERLDRIEGLLRGERAAQSGAPRGFGAAPGGPSTTPQSQPQSQFQPQAQSQPPAQPGASPPPAPPVPPPPPEYGGPSMPPPAPPMPPRDEAPSAPPPSAVPPMRPRETPPPPSWPAPPTAGAPAPPPPPPAPAAQPPAPPAGPSGPQNGGAPGALRRPSLPRLTVFQPQDGSLSLRIAPVAGFHGLMRVQDALTRMPSIAEAHVEAYSQGEARLRVLLSQPVTGDGLAEWLGERLGQEAWSEDASESERCVRLKLG